MNFIGWIRDLFGIQKDMYDTKRTRLEIKKLEDAEREKLITPATFDDVKKYDPKVRNLFDGFEKRNLKKKKKKKKKKGYHPQKKKEYYYPQRRRIWLWVVISIAALIIIAAMAYSISR